MIFGGTDSYDNLSDFRMYATALSAEDVKELYNTSLIVDNEGTVSAYELIEDEDVSIDEQGILKNQNIYETEAMNCAYTNYPGDYRSWDSNFYTPSNINNSTGCYRYINFPEKIENGQQIRIECDVEWSGGFDQSSTNGTFNIYWQGPISDDSGNMVWSGWNFISSVLENIRKLKDLVLSSESGIYHYDALVTIGQTINSEGIRKRYRFRF